MKQDTREFCNYVAKLRQQKADIIANRSTYTTISYDQRAQLQEVGAPIAYGKHNHPTAWRPVQEFLGYYSVPRTVFDGNKFADDLVACITKLDELEPKARVADMIMDKEGELQEQEKRNGGLKRSLREEVLKIQTLQLRVEKTDKEVMAISIEEQIKNCSRQQRAHILLKIWEKDDENSLLQKVAIAEQGFDANYHNSRVCKLLNIALYAKDSGLFKLLLNNGMDLGQRVGDKAVIQWILESNNQECIRELLKKGEDLTGSILLLFNQDYVGTLRKIHQFDPQFLINMEYEDHTIWEQAVIRQSYEVMKFLFSEGSGELYKRINFNHIRVRDGKSLMQIILECNNQDWVKKMLASGIDFSGAILDLLDKDGIECVQKIYQVKPTLLTNISQKGINLFEEAIIRKSYKTLNLLLSNENDFSSKGHSNEALLVRALKLGDEEAISILQAYNINYVKELRSVKKTNLELFEKIIDYIPGSYTKKNILDKVLDKGELAGIVETSLLMKKTNLVIKLVNIIPSTMEVLARIERTEIIEHLSTSRVVMVSDHEGNNLLHLACKHGNKLLLEKLLEHNTRLINSQNDARQTMLHILLEDTNFAEQQLADFIRIISRYAPDINILDNLGESAMDLAIGHSVVKNIFQNYHLIAQDNGATYRGIDNAELGVDFNALNLAGNITPDMH